MSRTIGTGDDIIDSRDIQERIDELESLGVQPEPEASDMPEDYEYNEERHELAVWLSLKEETEDAGWEHGITFIRDDYMEDYACDTAEHILDGAHWPFTCIDWGRATEDFKMDYSSVEIDGVDYWYRKV